ncbi:hypothetical protein Clacol_005155 [Clathrus columnatus]|uniref:Iminophenyl-pyruvate dimer synthase domain-containing protein n=1 Tax=Clathrus columnatus TaxID=1419009 RepID=A0AAV5AEJ2_9AGAM|nr:hypothetical protein Clacol_005155 [Clathrus columnatus]
MSNVFPPSNATGLFTSSAFAGRGFGAMLRTPGPELHDLGGIKLPELKTHLQAAILLELKTLPPYLYAAYSIKAPGPAKWSILNVAQQEMLHLALAGNILCAIGGEPKLYSLSPPGSGNPPEFPSYPDKMFYQETPLDLRGATKPNIRTFLELERPSILKDIDRVAEALDAYGSIGTFYWAIGEALKFNSNRIGDQALFSGDKKKQLQYGDGSWYNDEMVVVEDLNSALKALGIILDQGEGSQRQPPIRGTGSLDPPPPFAVRSHFEIFEDLYKGPPLDCYEVLENPKTKTFETGNQTNIHKVLLLGDAAFCYLLQTVETLWRTGGGTIKRMHFVNNNLHNIMLYVLRPLSTFLLSQKVKSADGTETNIRFNLFFNYYDFKTTGKLKKLQDLAKDAVGEFPSDKILLEVQKTVNALEDVEN